MRCSRSARSDGLDRPRGDGAGVLRDLARGVDVVRIWRWLVAWWRAKPSDYVSEQWLIEQRRRGCKNAFIGINWRWPVRKDWT